jgi:transcriptional regulator with PAS, ATPase and Fis domain
MIVNLNRRHGTRITGLQEDALNRLEQHPWPGNVRELRNVIERAVILTQEGSLGVKHLPWPAALPSEQRVAPTVDDATVFLRAGLTLSQLEETHIRITLKHTNNNKTRAAELLGISVRTLQNRCTELKMSDEEPD